MGINETYGNPDKNGDHILDSDWFNDNIRVFDLPWPMVLSWRPDDKVLRFQAHKLAGPRIVSALRKMGNYGLDYIYAHKMDRFGGCFNFRNIRGYNNILSRHSWGIAVDINPDLGPMGNFDAVLTYPSFIVDAFCSEGFIWGGSWSDRPDAMHFELPG